MPAKPRNYLVWPEAEQDIGILQDAGAKGTIYSPPYVQQRESRPLKQPHMASIMAEKFIPFSSRQEEQGAATMSDRTLEKRLERHLTLPKKVELAAEAARASGKTEFRHVFGEKGMSRFPP
jgi:hypothetical protein